MIISSWDRRHSIGEVQTRKRCKFRPLYFTIFFAQHETSLHVLMAHA